MSPNLSLRDYLKKYSSINNDFIDDFFGLYTKTTNDNDFIINLDVVSKWLESRKDHLKKTLKESYSLNLDYTIKKSKLSIAGRPNEIILINVNSFKRLCMLSKTKKAEEVRDYFLEIERHIDKYKNYIIEGLNNKVKKMSYELQPIKQLPTIGVIYILKDKSIDYDNIYRIGRTKNLKKRLSVHQTSHPSKLEIVYYHETAFINDIENCLRTLLKGTNYRNKKDFYEVNLRIIKELIEQCECMRNNVIKNGKNIKDVDCKYYIQIIHNIIKKKEKIHKFSKKRSTK
jgi:phage anti-repressor protein